MAKQPTFKADDRVTVTIGDDTYDATMLNPDHDTDNGVALVERDGIGPVGVPIDALTKAKEGV